LHGHDARPIRRISQENWPPFGAAVGAAFAASGLPFRRDQNGEFEDGIFPPAFSNGTIVGFQRRPPIWTLRHAGAPI